MLPGFKGDEASAVAICQTSAAVALCNIVYSVTYVSNPKAVGLLLNDTAIAKIPCVNAPVLKLGVKVSNGGGGEGFTSVQTHLLVAYLASSNTL